MRSRVVLLLLTASLAGCASRPKTGDAGPDGAAVSAGGSAKNQAAAPLIVPATQAHGRVESVNPTLRFVVLDFSLRPMPALDQRLSLFRGPQKVGEVKITGPEMDGYIAADLISGTAQPGDEARPE